MLYAYGAVIPGTPAPACPGILGASVDVLDCGELGVAVSELPAAPDAAPERLKEHHRVTLALAPQGVAPFRFGTIFADRDALSRALAPRSAALLAAVKDVPGCVELSVCLPLPGVPEAAMASPGAAYLLRKKRLLDMEDHARDTADRLRERLGEMVRDSRGEARAASASRAAAVDGTAPSKARASRPQLDRRSESCEPAGTAQVALLVRYDQVEEVKARIRELAPEAQISGPWAPSSFV